MSASPAAAVAEGSGPRPESIRATSRRGTTPTIDLALRRDRRRRGPLAPMVRTSARLLWAHVGTTKFAGRAPTVRLLADAVVALARAQSERGIKTVSAAPVRRAELARFNARLDEEPPETVRHRMLGDAS